MGVAGGAAASVRRPEEADKLLLGRRGGGGGERWRLPVSALRDHSDLRWLRGAPLPECELRVHGAGVRDAGGHGRRGLEPGEGDGVDVQPEEEEEQAGEQDVSEAFPLYRRR